MYPFVETIRIENGQMWHIPYHNARLNATRDFMGWSEPIDLATVIRTDFPQKRHKLRVVYGKEIGEWTCEPYIPRCIRSLKLVSDPNIRYAFKSTERTGLQQLFDKRGTCDEVLVVRNGLLTDTSIANIALFDGTHWFTPETPLLKGTMRQRLLDEGIVREACLLVTDLPSFSYLRLMNAMVDWGEWEIPVSQIFGDD